MLLLSMVRYQVMLSFRQDAIAINKLCKLNFRYFNMYVLSFKSAAGLSGLF